MVTSQKALLNQWTEYCKDLYSFQLMTDPNILQNKQTKTSEPTVLQKEVKIGLAGLGAHELCVEV